MARGRPPGLRLSTAERMQRGFELSSLDELLSADHRARQVWDYVDGLDLGVFYRKVRTTRQSSGRPPIDPAILVSLWLYATLDGVGSARLLDRLCGSDLAYRWLCGGVGVNYHTLADFRTAAGGFLDDLLSRSMAGLIASGAVDVRTVAVDGLRLRAAAGSSSFRRSERLEELYQAARQAVEELRREVEEEPGTAERRSQARRHAVAEDRLRRLEQARQAQVELEQRHQEQDRKQRRKEPRRKKPPRSSTSDPQAQVMKMADGGYRPAFNVQFKTAVQSGSAVVGVSISNSGSDNGQITPAVEEIKTRYGVEPNRMLVDGGFGAKEDIEAIHARGITLYCPLSNKGKGDPAAPRRGDGPGARAWRKRMARLRAQAIYKRRFATERPHADMRNRGLHRVRVRGMEKVKAVVLWHVHAFNFLLLHKKPA